MASSRVASRKRTKDVWPLLSEPLEKTNSPPLPQPPSVTMSQLLPTPSPQSPETMEEDDYSILPLVHSIIKGIYKDSPDVHEDLNALQMKFQEMRTLIGSMPGIHLSPEQQQQQLHSLQEQVRAKNELLQKYKDFCMFETPKE